MSSNDIDIDEMFSKMSEKLGWLQLGDVDAAISSLTKKQRSKKSTKKCPTTKKISSSSSNSNTTTTTTTTTSSSSTSSKVKPQVTTKKLGVSRKSVVKSVGACNADVVTVTRDRKKNMKPDLLDGTAPKAMNRISPVCSDTEEEKEQLAAMETQLYFDRSSLSFINGNNDIDDNNNSSNDINNNNNNINYNNNINDDHKDYDNKLGRDNMNLDTTVFFQPPEPLSPSHRYSDNSKSSSLTNQSDLSSFDDSAASIAGICKKISFTSDDSTTERSLNNSDTVSNTSNPGSNAVEKSHLTTMTMIQTPPAIAETVKKSPGIPNTPFSIAKPSLPKSAPAERNRGTCPLSSSIQRSRIDGDFGKEDGSSKGTGDFYNDREMQRQTPSLTNNTPVSYFTVKEFFISDDDDDDDADNDYVIDCDDDDTFQDYFPSHLPHQFLSDIKREKPLPNDSAGSLQTPLAAHDERRAQSELRYHKYNNNNNKNNSDVVGKTWKSREPSSVYISTDGSSDDDDVDDEFEAFLTKLKTPARKKPTTSPMSMDVFIVSNSESSSGSSDCDDKNSISLYHRTRPVSPDITPFRGTFSNNRVPSVCKDNPHQSDPRGKRSDRTVTPIKETKPKAKAVKHDSDDYDDVFKKPTVAATINTPKPPVLKKRSTPMHNIIPNIPHGRKVPQTCPTLKHLHQPPLPPPPPPLLHPTSKRCDGNDYTSFLKSLSGNTENVLCFNEEATKYVKHFKKHRVELVKKLFKIYNETIFDNKFPTDFSIIWNKRLLTTAGLCRLRHTHNTQSKTKVQRTAEINLATKVCDTAERVRDTLIHELCHAAVWLFDGSRDGHGKVWQMWAKQANRRYLSALPVIARCHNYVIAKKYTYKCVRCGHSFGRHSKSLDTTKKICLFCRGRFVLVAPTTSTNDSNKGSSSATTPARTPNKFALFVKEHYGTVKKTNSCSHKDVMNILSQKFKQTQIS